MGEFVYIYVKGRDFSANQGQLDNARNAGATRTIGVERLDEFETTLEDLKKMGVKITRLDISSHGSPGVLDFRGDRLDLISVGRFKGKGFEDLFVADARVLIYGCNVAAVGDQPNTNGREFLREFAKTFLFKGGGHVSGSTTATLTVPLFGKTFFPDAVNVFVKKGGTNLRIATGENLSKPDGYWLVKATNGDPFLYYFTWNQDKVRWIKSKSIFSKDETGYGKWRNGDLMRINWESGSSEEWDLPLFSKEQSGSWNTKEGQTYLLTADWLHL